MISLRGGAASWLAAAGAMAAAAPALAGPLLVTPTTVEFAPGRRSAAIEVTNQGDTPADLQFRAFAWSQDATGDRLAPTTALAISPPIATLPPHGRQTFRVLAVDPATPGAERSFRLKLNELPRPATDAVAINVEFSLPVFMTPSGTAPVLAARIIDRGTTIEVANTGSRRIRIASLEIVEPGGSRAAVPLRSTTYVLAAATRRLPMPTGLHPLPGARLVGVGDTGSIDVPLAPVATP